MNLDLSYAIHELLQECPAPFVLDEDNDSHLAVKDCCGAIVLSNHLPRIGVNIFAQKDHLRLRLIARVLVALSKKPEPHPKPMSEQPTPQWYYTGQCLPEEGKVVMTKIDNEKGCRNETTLKRRGNLWFFPDDSMYVYYTPTHWREVA